MISGIPFWYGMGKAGFMGAISFGTIMLSITDKSLAVFSKSYNSLIHPISDKNLKKEKYK